MTKFLIFIIIILFVITFYLGWENRQIKSDNTILKEELENINVVITSLQQQTDTTAQSSSEQGDLKHLLTQYLDTHQSNEPNTVLTNEQLQEQQYPNLIPLEGEFALSQKFHKNHDGIDLAANLGTKVVAAGLGVVIGVYVHPQLGNVVEINHFNEYKTVYAHLVKAIVEIGQPVKRGELIGFVGNTGRSSAPHLHFEIIKNEDKVNPANILGLE
jgi:murein DD-endopeptidase MepM/ murein hydrolase activator NlpD